MILIRQFEEVCAEAVLSGEIHGEMHLSVGQEAIGAAMVGVLRDDDAVVSTHRGHAHAIGKGVPLKPLLAEIFEKETGLCRGRGGHMHLFDPERNFSCTGIVGASLPIALGYAYAAQIESGDSVAVGITGDGGANAGPFHECLNIAGAWRLPLVVVVENNRYGISVPITSVSATATIAERAAAYNAMGAVVDGADVEATAEGLRNAIDHVRAGRGPALLEVVCVRLRGHYEGDTDHYRSTSEKEAMEREGDPISNATEKLVRRGELSPRQIDGFFIEAKQELSEILASVRADQQPDANEALSGVFVEATNP
jgi:pyruvate dehydrogenase E1 component alpha subunit